MPGDFKINVPISGMDDVQGYELFDLIICPLTRFREGGGRGRVSRDTAFSSSPATTLS